MEVHWTSAYVATVGMLIAVLVTGGFVAESMWVNAAATWCIALGAGLIIIDGLGLLTWLLDRVKAPRWYRVVLVIGAVLFSPAAAAVLGVIGIVDIALRPRRRSSGTLTRRD
jgi:uncharacterized protein YybS (DUF2232 family)